MQKIDLIIDTLDYLNKFTNIDVAEALTAARELRELKPVAELIGKKGHVCFQLYDSKLPINTKLYALGDEK